MEFFYLRVSEKALSAKISSVKGFSYWLIDKLKIFLHKLVFFIANTVQPTEMFLNLQAQQDKIITNVSEMELCTTDKLKVTKKVAYLRKKKFS